MFPREFLEETKNLLGSEHEAFLRALDEGPALALRINPLRKGAAEAAAPYIDAPVPWAKYGYYLKPDTRPGASVAHDCGAFYLQEASAMVSASVLDPKPGEKILDLCAAPGGKTTQIAGLMEGQGLLISNEPVPSRAKILAENLERLGIPHAVAVCAYPDHLAARWEEFFDAVLVDAPCSGEGMFRREPASRDEWQPSSPEGCAKRQADILDQAARMVRPGGRLVYSTCTFNHYEDEETIERFLNRHPEFTAEDFELNGLGASSNGMIRIWPHRVRGDGHFAARLRKEGSPRPSRERTVKLRGGKPSGKPARTISEETPEQLLRRLEESVCALPDTMKDFKLIRQADYVHALPACAPSMDGVKTVKPGVCLMRVGRSHIQPMPALARLSGMIPKREYALTEEEAKRYLEGAKDILPESAEKGWTLLTLNDLPMGFVKGH